MGADAGADGINVLVVAPHRYLRAGTGLAGDGADLDRAVVDLGHFELEQALDKAGVRAGDDDLRAAGLAAHIDKIDLDALTLDQLFALDLLAGEQVKGEELVEGQRIKVYLVDVRRQSRGPQVVISRTHPGLVKRLFELEVPEIYDGTVEIRSIAREAGSRTKIAVWSNDENVDPIGACVGPHGQRVNSIVDELRGEKIDIIKYSDDPAEYIAAALAPADVISVRLAEEGKACRVIVPDDQLSLAIGKEGQNARLAARLVGYKIDIKPESYQEEE